MLDDDLSGCTLADVLRRLEAGKVGHRAVMAWLDVDNYHDLVKTMHLNGRIMPGHREMVVTPETQALIRQITRRLPAPRPSQLKTPRPRPPRAVR